MYVFSVDPDFLDTCALKAAGSNQRCVDHMDDGATLPGNGSALQAMEGEGGGEAVVKGGLRGAGRDGMSSWKGEVLGGVGPGRKQGGRKSIVGG